MDCADAGHRIFTVGHGTGSFTELETLCTAHGVQTIIDVRTHPYSRRAPDFTKDSLADAAAATGLGYRWMGDRLGGRPHDPALRTPAGDPDWSLVAATSGFRAALDEVAALARGGRVALLCAERDPEHCHRSTLLAPHLEELGFTVCHILADGSLRPHQETLFGAS